MDDFLFRGDLSDLDPDVAALVDLEAIRQAKRLILIPSESSVPVAVRQAVGSVFHNIYAEGYPDDDMAGLSRSRKFSISISGWPNTAVIRISVTTRAPNSPILSRAWRGGARRKCSPPSTVGPDDIWVNVQPLSGSPANSAVYSALMQPGDTLMGMDLLHGGHLTHGSPVSRSGIIYNVVSYAVDPDTERLNYDTIRALALEHRPKVIVAGFTSYPYAPDWKKFRAIADEAGAYLLADVSHVSGLLAAGVFPSPVGIAHVISFTTHKTLAGPRGAVLMTTDRKTRASCWITPSSPASRAGRTSTRLRRWRSPSGWRRPTSSASCNTRRCINAQRLAQKLAERGLRIPHGGTDTHLLLVDCKSVQGADGTPLSGDMAARILDLAGIVCNRNTIPGDESPFRASGIRLGTPWITQRGFREPQIDQLADIIADVLLACEPFSYVATSRKDQPRAKVDFDVLMNARQAVHRLADAGRDRLPGARSRRLSQRSGRRGRAFRRAARYPELEECQLAHDRYLRPGGDGFPRCGADQRCPRAARQRIPADLGAGRRRHAAGARDRPPAV